MSLIRFLLGKIRELMLMLPLPGSWLEKLREDDDPAAKDYFKEDSKPGAWRMPTALAFVAISAYVIYWIMT